MVKGILPPSHPANETVSGMPQRVKFFYIKGQHFRVIHVDGSIGGLTPRGLLHIALFNERPAIPQMTEHGFTEEGYLGDATVQEGKEGIVRELEVDILMSRATAVEMRDWLSNRIEDLDRYLAAAGTRDSKK